jgi:hypothetical protein
VQAIGELEHSATIFGIVRFEKHCALLATTFDPNSSRLRCLKGFAMK